MRDFISCRAEFLRRGRHAGSIGARLLGRRRDDARTVADDVYRSKQLLDTCGDAVVPGRDFGPGGLKIVLDGLAGLQQ